MSKISWTIITILLLTGISQLKSFAQTAQFKNGCITENYSRLKPNAGYSYDSAQSHLAIKLNPFSWLYDDVRICVEHPISNKVSLEFRIGYKNTVINPYELKYQYVDYTFFNDSIGDYQTLKYNCNGFNVGIAGNFYLRNSWYIQPSFFYKRYTYTYADEYTWHEGPMSYLELYNNERTDYLKSVIAFEFRYGKTFFFNRFLINLYTGLGIRYKWRELLDNNYDWIYHAGYTRRSLEATLPTAHLGVNIGWRLGK